MGLYMGSIAEIGHNANLMIGSLFESDFPMEKFKPKKIFIDSEGLLVVRSDDNLLAYKDERIISHMVTEAALRFLILHEIGHHAMGHITKLSNNYKKFALLKASDNTNSDFEIEADTFASEKLAQEYSLLLQGLINKKESLNEFCTEGIELMALNIMITAITLPFSILYQPFKNKGTSIEGTIAYREIFALINLTINLYNNMICRKSAIYGLCNKTSDELEKLHKISNQIIDIEKIRITQNIDFFAFFQCIIDMFIESKLLYYNVNKIANIDIYLENYINVLSFFQSKNDL